MPRTTGRTLELLGLLQSPRTWTSAELTARLQVSDRTLRRDIDDLRGLGYGIESVSGTGGGYRLGVGASIPPLVLSADEAVAIGVGLRAAASATVAGIEDAAARALAKLEQSLSAETRERISAIEQAILPLGDLVDQVDLDTVVAVARAIRDCRSLRIDYRDHHGAESRRTIEPHRIVHTGSKWYLVARDPNRDVWRTLRLDRVTPRLPLAQTFIRQEIPDDAVREFTTRSISTSPYKYRYRVRMHASAADVRTIFKPSVAQVISLDSSTSELEAGATTPEEFALYLGRSGIEFDVLDGEDLRGVLVSLGGRLVRAGTGVREDAGSRATTGTLGQTNQ